MHDGEAAGKARYLCGEQGVGGGLAKCLGIRLLVLNASSAQEIEDAFAIMAQQKIEALLAAQDAFYFIQRHQLVGLAARYRMPAIYHAREVVEAGGLMSYG
jgi:putative tryptophan/tyrosine transport system substrate-binding protein